MKLLKKILLHVVGISFMFSTLLALAQDEEKKEEKRPFPYGCTPVGHKFNYFTLILKPSAKFHPQTTYFIHNISDKSVTLLQARTGNEPYIMSTKSTINPNRWSVFATDEKKIIFICASSDKNLLHDRVIDCKKTLKVCEFTHVKFGENNRGNYWAIENNTMLGAKHAMRWHGVLLIDPKKVRQEKEGSEE